MTYPGLGAMVIAFFLLTAGAAAAEELIPGYPEAIETHDPREIAQLPRYCVYTQVFRQNVPGGNNQAEIDRWYAQLGPTFHAMHHYCWGLIRTNRALFLATNARARNFYLETAVGEYDYVIAHATPGFVLLPEIFTKKAENLIRLGKGRLALFQLARAIELKPDYWPPYVVMSDYYKSTGDISRARELLETALLFAPEAQSLKKRLAALDDMETASKPTQRSR
jgi:hypothetical protein